jgi:hypothetical protein
MERLLGVGDEWWSYPLEAVYNRDPQASEPRQTPLESCIHSVELMQSIDVPIPDS